MNFFLKTFLLFFVILSPMYANEIEKTHKDKLENILHSNTLKVCIWTSYYGISYLDERTQKLVGIDSDLAYELASDLGVSLQFVPISFATLISDVTNNKCDIAMFAIGNTEARRAKVRFTTPHLASDIYAITTKQNKKIKNWEDIDKENVVIAVAKGTYHVAIMQQRLKHAKLVIVDSYKAREKELLSGRVDLFMTDFPFGKRMLDTTEWAKLIAPTTPYYFTPYAWVMQYGNERFYQKVEQFIQDIKDDGRLLRIAKKHSLEPIVKLP